MGCRGESGKVEQGRGDVVGLWNVGGRFGLSVFFFKQKTAYEILTCDWSSDVCSSDLSGL